MKLFSSAVALAGLAGAVALAVFVSGSSDRTASAATPVAPLAPAPPAQGGGYGTIKGRLVWGGAEAPKAEVSQAVGKAIKDPEICASKEPIYKDDLVVDPKTKGVKYGFAFLPRPTGKNPEAEEALLKKEPTVEIDQKNCTFVPHSLAMHQKQAIVFKSSDDVGHNIHYTPLGGGGKNFALPKGGKAEEKMVKDRFPIPLKCDIHPWMSGTIMVFDHPFFAVTKDDGSFEITGVPAGMQNLLVWQEDVGYVTTGGSRGMPVKVQADKTTDVGEIKLDPAKVKRK